MKHPKPGRALLPKPGDTIVETIQKIGMTQSELAERMGKTPSKINDVISGKEPITVNTALQLEMVLKIDASFWLQREASYREKLARIEDEEKLACWIPWMQLHPVKELRKCGVLPPTGEETDIVKKLLLFYGVVSPQQWEMIYVPQYAMANYRKSDAAGQTMAAITAWLRMGEVGMAIDLREYDKDSFKNELEKIRNIAVKQPPDFADQLKRRCESAGVAIVYTPCLAKAPISGAARWINGRPLIQLTDRYKANDRFWFTFFHEAGHVLLHGKKDVFLEEAPDHEQNIQKEEEADAFASRWLLPEGFLNEVTEPVTDECITRIAEKYNIHPGIVVGRLQKRRRMEYSEGNHFKVRISLFE